MGGFRWSGFLRGVPDALGIGRVPVRLKRNVSYLRLSFCRADFRPWAGFTHALRQAQDMPWLPPVKGGRIPGAVIGRCFAVSSAARLTLREVMEPYVALSRSGGTTGSLLPVVSF